MRIKELEAERKRYSDNQILGIVRKANLSIEELAELLGMDDSSHILEKIEERIPYSE